MLRIEIGFPVFLKEGAERIGAVRETKGSGFILFVENAGEFEIPMTSVKAVHDGKVLLDPAGIDRRLLNAIAHSSDAEDPNLTG